MDTCIKWPSKKIRGTFISYFEERGHTFVPSSSVVPYNDPTLLFTNAGMNQYKSIFLGTVDLYSPLGKLRRAVNSQKVIRAGGKHNDLEDVGKDSYHHTFFEMLGNWSFGDYFKKEAISYSWDLLTRVYGLPIDQLYVTYFEGDEENGILPDIETRDLWISIGVNENHVIPGSKKDNFWEMGDTGPCGPCTEIHYDRIGKRNAASLVNKDDFNVIEIWNNVFIQYNREKDGKLSPLPSKHVDTGMGFERLVSILQNKSSNYDTDIFSPLLQRVHEITGVRPYQGKFGAEDIDGIDTAYRVIVDHVRTLTFSISDGCVPSNDGRGYVIRRILRRGARYVWKKFNYPIGDFFSSLAPTLITQMVDAFPELEKARDTLKNILDAEEMSFSKTLERGEKILDKYLQNTMEKGVKVLSGTDVWSLYETYGFPVDLINLIAEERGMEIDQKGFKDAETRSKEISRKSYNNNLQKLKTLEMTLDNFTKLRNMNIMYTDDSYKYNYGTIDSNIKAIFYDKLFKNSTKDIKQGERMIIILDKTNFYGEEGGQEGDIGKLILEGKAEFFVEDTQLNAGYVLHIGYMNYGDFELGDKIICEYEDLERRKFLRNNHSATHILNFSLKKILGDTVYQKGSLVAAEKLRFDFSYNSKISMSDLEKIEDMCNSFILGDYSLYYKEIDLNLAKKIQGIRTLSGEAYPDPVRVVSIGVDLNEVMKSPILPKWMDYSIELCGGTHVNKTSDIKNFVIVDESGISKGIRRIVALTSHQADLALRLADEFSERLTFLESLPFCFEKIQRSKSMAAELDSIVISAIQKFKFREALLKIQKDILESEKIKKKEDEKKVINLIKTYFSENPDKSYFIINIPDISANMKVLSNAINYIKANEKDKSVYLFAVDQSQTGNVAHMCYVSKSAHANANGQEWANIVSTILGGKSGGKEDSAQGIGTNIEKIDDAIAAAATYINERLHI
ncbi:alanine-tRNA ligase [Pneumocystis carinii B80]|uniref:Alanine--tRNA ligase n=1 Tax=Pneumocystis carinii (strain B80) TaxID=1408658 RepID=A0A0W4ZQT5_PNEC8|nr:alanine-tRNA ligase [Pneumocystis carinii B80]KTW30733.1 alanine-tRNA ligase [Pneumocystis carinii B80]